MTIEQAQAIDFISIDKSTDEVILTISDHLEWDDENEHLLLLQEKLNSYLAFVESGEILEFPPSEAAKDFLERATAVIGEAGFTFSYSVAE